MGKNISPEKNLTHPLTTLPLALASPDGDLGEDRRQSLGTTG